MSTVTTPEGSHKPVTELVDATVRFCGDSGDGMQLAGTQFTNTSAIFGNDLSTNFPELATHGFLHRRWVDTVGYFLPPLFSCDWNDVWISEVAKKIGRAVPLPDMMIEHQHHSFGKREHDQTDAEREERGARDGVVDLYKRTSKEREQDAAKLRAVMA